MGRRKGEDSIASKKRRMPYVAKIKRDDPPSRPQERIAAGDRSVRPFDVS